MYKKYFPSHVLIFAVNILHLGQSTLSSLSSQFLWPQLPPSETLFLTQTTSRISHSTPPISLELRGILLLKNMQYCKGIHKKVISSIKRVWECTYTDIFVDKNSFRTHLRHNTPKGQQQLKRKGKKVNPGSKKLKVML